MARQTCVVAVGRHWLRISSIEPAVVSRPKSSTSICRYIPETFPRVCTPVLRPVATHPQQRWFLMVRKNRRKKSRNRIRPKKSMPWMWKTQQQVWKTVPSRHPLLPQHLQLQHLRYVDPGDHPLRICLAVLQEAVACTTRLLNRASWNSKVVSLEGEEENSTNIIIVAYFGATFVP